MPSYGWLKRHTIETIVSGVEITAISAGRLDGKTLKLGKPIRDESNLKTNDYIVIHDLQRGIIEKLKIVNGTIIHGPDPRAEWQYLGDVRLIEVERENGGIKKYSLHSIGVSPYPQSNQYSSNTLTFKLSETESIPI